MPSSQAGDGDNHPLSTVPVYTALGKGISGQRSHGKENSTNTLAYVTGKPISFSFFPASPHTCIGRDWNRMKNSCLR